MNICTIVLLCIFQVAWSTATSDENVYLLNDVRTVDNTRFLDIPCKLTNDHLVNITWKKNEVDLRTIEGDEAERFIIDEASRNLTIKNPKATDAGIYRCVVVDKPETFTEIHVYSLPVALIKVKGKSKTVVQGEPLTLPCEYGGYPRPTLTWFKDNDIITNDTRFKFEEKEDANGDPINTLTLEDAEEDDRAVYTCLATNAAGEGNSTTTVRVKDKLAALWPFLGIVAEVAILCTIIFIYERRRSKQEMEESDTDQSPETKNASDNKDKDVRQRK